MNTEQIPFDVAITGAGAVSCAIARELSKYANEPLKLVIQS